MKKAILILVAAISFSSCGGNKTSKLTEQIKATKEKVMEAHDAVMPKMGELRRATRTLDTLVLSASFQGDTLRAKQLAQRLIRANENMMEWMRAYTPDSTGSPDEVILSYYESERIKVEEVKTDMLNALDSAHSFFQSISQ